MRKVIDTSLQFQEITVRFVVNKVGAFLRRVPPTFFAREVLNFQIEKISGFFPAPWLNAGERMHPTGPTSLAPRRAAALLTSASGALTRASWLCGPKHIRYVFFGATDQTTIYVRFFCGPFSRRRGGVCFNGEVGRLGRRGGLLVGEGPLVGLLC